MMKDAHRKVLMVAAAVSVLSLAACSSKADDSTTSGMSATRVKIYQTLPELWRDSDVLVQAHVQSVDDQHASVGDLPQGAPYFDVRVVIDEVLISQAEIQVRVGQAVSVRYYGATNMEFKDGLPLLSTDANYALFLDQFEYEPGSPTGEWVVAGATGAYELEGSGAPDSIVATHMDPLQSGLPDRIDLRELTVEATRQP